MENVTIQIRIQKDAKNEPFVKVFYNGLDAFNLDEEMKIVAGYVARKAVTGMEVEGIVYVSTETGEVLENGQFDKFLDRNYCISGSLSGRENVMNLVQKIRLGTTNEDVNIPVFVSDGYVDPIFINDQNNYFETLDELLNGPSESPKMGK